MNITIPAVDLTPDYNAGTPIFPEVWFTIVQEWVLAGALISGGVDGLGNNLYLQQTPDFNFLKEGLNDVFNANGYIENQPMAIQGEKAILDFDLRETIPAAQVRGGVDKLPNRFKITSTGEVLKKLGEWGDASWEIWENTVTGEVQVYMNPFNGTWVDFHLVRSLGNYYDTTNFPTLTSDATYKTVQKAEDDRAVNPGDWTKIRPA